MSTVYRLGLDLGTNSLGWAMWELGEDGPTEVIDAGVRIFSDGRESGKKVTLQDSLAVKQEDDGSMRPQQNQPSQRKRVLVKLGKPLAVKRRDARGMRRRRDRLLQRKRVLVNTLVKEGLWPKDPELRLRYSEWDPYHLRAKGIASRLTPEELGRVLLHLCQRRGFKSNRKEIFKDKENPKDEKGGKDEKAVNKQRIKALNEELSRFGAETLGEYMNAHKRSGVRFRGDSDFYPDRQHYIDEFRMIKDRQKENFPTLNWQRIEEILFYQRPLVPQKKGMCRYYTDQERANKSLPSTHRFRILQELSNLRMIGSHGESVGLSHDERDLVFNLLEHQKSLGFDSLRKKLGTDCRFNLEDGKRVKLLGNETSYLMRKPDLFGALWDEFDDEKQDEIVRKIMEADDVEELREYFESFPIDEKNNKSLLELTLPTGISRYSSLLHRECVRIMKKEYCGYSEAMESLELDHRAPEGGGDEKRLPYYGKVLRESCISRNDPNQNDEERAFGKIGNPTVHIALNQLRKVINALINKYGKPEEIVIELSRGLKVGRQKLSDIIDKQSENQKRNERLMKELTETFNSASRTRANREKLIYYHELQRNNLGAPCPYCGRIISADELFSGNIEVEHILPFSRTMDDGRNNKTVAHRRCNLLKREQSPYEAFGQSPEGYRWEEIQDRIRSLPKAKQWRFQQDAMQRYEDEESGFLQRQITDNAYIARIARRYLTAVCPPNKIWGVTGRHTAVLRRKWNLNSILSKDAREKNRSDHRHHAVDAAVIGLIDRSLVQKIAVANRLGNGDLDLFTFKVPEFPGGVQGRERLFETIKKILPSIKPDHGLQGRFFKETAYGKIRKALPLAADELKEEMIPNIVPAHLRQEVQNIVSELGLRKGCEKIQEHHPKLSVLQDFWVTSKPLTDLEESDLQTPSYKKDEKGPSDFHLREKIKAYINSHPGETFENLIKKYSEEYGIRHIRYIPKNQEIEPIRSSLDKDGKGGKGYELDDYAYVDVWMLPVAKGKKTKYKGVFVSRLEANQINQGLREQRRPHPAAKKLMRLFKQDTIAILENDEWKYYKVNGYSTTLNLIDILPIWQSDGDWFEKTNKSSLLSGYPEIKTRNFKSINAIWQKFTVKKITVHYDGTYR